MEKETDKSFVRERSSVTQLPDGVFYNPVQQFNRDISIAVIEQYCRDFSHRKAKKDNNHFTNSAYMGGIRILEALSASGLRSMRMAQELATNPDCHIKQIIANDIDPNAVRLIKENAQRNGVEQFVTANCEDAILLMTKHACSNDKLEVIDLDPYGSASRFLDSASHAIANNGLLCVTCTDMAVLAGAAVGTSWGKYGASSVRKFPAAHEMSLRILLHAIQSACGRYGKIIEPLLSLSIDFYVRVFVRVRDSPQMVKRSAASEAILLVCVGCKAFHLQPLGDCSNDKIGAARLHGIPSPKPSGGEQSDASAGADGVCPHCGHGISLGGPIWAGELHDKVFLGKILDGLNSAREDSASTLPPFGTLSRMIGMLQVAVEELDRCPLYYISDKLASTLHTPTPSFTQIRSAILHAGYRVSGSHCAKNSLKTDAPAHVLWHIVRAWAKRVSTESGKAFPDPKHLQQPKSVAAMLMRDLSAMNYPELQFVPNFDPHPNAQPLSRESKLVRFPPNPEKHWGPKARAKAQKRKDVE